jgi:hypothetical protein
MRLYAEARSPLLNEICEDLDRANFPQPIIRSSRGEAISIPWMPDCKHGVLRHDSASDEWEQSEPSQEPENILIDVDGDGSVDIRPGDDSYVYLGTSIYSYDELLELMAFYEQAIEEKLRPDAFAERPLSTVVESVFLLFRGEDFGASKLLELKGEYRKWMPDGLVKYLDAYFTGDSQTDFSSGLYWDFKAFLENENIEIPQSELTPLKRDDLVLDSTHGWRTASELIHEVHGAFGYTPCLVVRLKETFSRMYFADFVRLSPEGQQMTVKFMAGWKSIRSTLKETTISAPTNKNDQIAKSVTLRSARRDYLDTVKRLSKVTEPLHEIARTYRKRSRAAKLLHSDFLEDTVAMESPLPFFIEYPYRRFRKQDDELEKVKAGQRLLTILSKVPLFLLIEELRATKQSLGEELMTKVGERPASDGVLVDLQKSAVDAIQSAGIKLPVFARLTDLVANNTLLEQMVTARNRWHHEPFDHENFLRAMTEYSARYIPLLRQTLADISFMVPHRMEFVDGQKIVVGDDIRSADAHFRKTQWPVELPVESFPTNVLVAYRANCKTTVPLGNLITSQFVDRKMLDFGVFDRQSKKGEPVFVFLRSLNEG